MSSKTGKFFVLATVTSAIVLGGIHLGFESDVDRLEFRLDMAMIDYSRASAECRSDPDSLEGMLVGCPKAARLGSDFDRAADDLEEARRQAWLFLMLAIVVPSALVILGLVVRRLSRAGSKRTNDEPLSVENS